MLLDVKLFVEVEILDLRCECLAPLVAWNLLLIKGCFRVATLQVLSISFVHIGHINIRIMNLNRTTDFYSNKYSLTVGFASSAVVKHPAP
jgi:hypothetical protein